MTTKLDLLIDDLFTVLNQHGLDAASDLKKDLAQLVEDNVPESFHAEGRG